MQWGSWYHMKRSCVGFWVTVPPGIPANRHMSEETFKMNPASCMWLQLSGRPQARITKWELPSWAQSMSRPMTGNNNVIIIIWSHWVLKSFIMQQQVTRTSPVSSGYLCAPLYSWNKKKKKIAPAPQVYCKLEANNQVKNLGCLYEVLIWG